ncbi:MAG: peptide MFS transporter [Chitinophagales bacterium]
MSQSQTTGHPRGLYVLFFTEMWERFSYYGMRAIFTLYLTKALLFSDESASNMYGSYTGLVYLTPLLGGYIADKYWGNRRSILVGGIVMAIGQFLMFTSGSMLDNLSMAKMVMIMGLTLLIIGNGFFKPNISTMVGQLYPKGDVRVDSAFTIFYMGINLGAFFSPLICGGLGDTGNVADFRWGFLAAGIGMLVSSLSFELLKNKYLVTPSGEAIGMPTSYYNKGGGSNANALDANSQSAAKETPNFESGKVIMSLAVAAGLFAVMYWVANLDLIFSAIFGVAIAVPMLIITDGSLNKDERSRIWVIFILAFFVIFFWSAFEQAGASLTLFADRNTNRDIHIFLPGWLISLVILVAVYYLMKGLTWFFEWTKRTGNIVTAVISIVVVILYATGIISNFSMEEFPASWFQSINPLGIILLAPLFSMLWVTLNKKGMEPASPFKMAIGLLLLCLGYIVIAFGVHGVDASVKISMWFLVSLYVLHTMGELCLSPIGLSMVSKLAPVRFASLLMGTWFLANAFANKLAGSLSALIPPSADQFEKASGNGIDLLPILNGTTTATPEQLKTLEGAGLPTHWPHIFGMQVDNLYTFFTVFIVMSGAASFVLFILASRLKKMMKGIH